MMARYMNEEAAKHSLGVDIQSCALAGVQTEAAGYDVVMMAPQVKYALRKMRKALKGTTVFLADTRTYGAMDARSALSDALDNVEEW